MSDNNLQDTSSTHNSVATNDSEASVSLAGSSVTQTARPAAEFIEAAKKGDVQKINSFLENATVLSIRCKGAAFYYAVLNKHVAIEERLMQLCRLEKNFAAVKGEALCRAAANGRLEVVQLLLGYSSSEMIPANFEGRALYFAILNKQLEIVELLLAYATLQGVDTEVQTRAFYRAAFHGNFRLVQILKSQVPTTAVRLAIGKAMQQFHVLVAAFLMAVFVQRGFLRVVKYFVALFSRHITEPAAPAPAPERAAGEGLMHHHAALDLSTPVCADIVMTPIEKERSIEAVESTSRSSISV